MATVLELQEKRNQTWERMKEIVDDAEKENRGLTTEEDTNWKQASADISDLDARIERQQKLERTPAKDPEKIARFVSPGEIGRDSEEYRESFNTWLRMGDAG